MRTSSDLVQRELTTTSALLDIDAERFKNPQSPFFCLNSRR
jgi:hypothetical protein